MPSLDTLKTAIVCVTQQKTCETLIRTAAQRCGSDRELHILHVSRDNWNFFENIKEGEALEYLFIIAKSVGAELTILHSKDVAGTIAQFAHHYDADVVYLGASRSPERRRDGSDAGAVQANGLMEKLVEMFADSSIRIEVIPT